MTPRWSVRPGPPATPADRRAGRLTTELLAGELARARAAALAWRNGLAALFAGLLGFGLVKGRTDVGKLAPPYDALVGGALLLCLVFGTLGALLLLRAAHGAPIGVRLPAGVPAAATALHLGDHMETRRTVRALTRGVVLTIGCGAMLVTGVALTWYGPGKDGPRILVRTPSGDVCGEPVRADAGRLLVRTDTGEVTVRLDRAESLAAVDACPPGPSAE
ncbi:hypothetical protein GTY81_16200 [Streptomyces sp. SID8366]|uniref:hypothetical protein n=1 Tax=unclassified Streptomyces TaxID=2593676 RepID=UPI000DBAB880|nr:MULTISPECIES: hypothetical protein [unclassified Streptomyces]MYU05404.1 hypothetical protein [Streptomyces sp. SID8366]MYU66625.1 hypothetical protein [Streptomyces sp. SID69]RAJ66290.1 hypothetical protein K376_00557 [Streptomyces sp. PsTaAH-130]